MQRDASSTNRVPRKNQLDTKGPSGKLPSNVKLLAAASLLNDIASEMIYPLMPQFLMSVLGGNRFYLGVIEGFAESVSSLLKLAAGAWSDGLKHRKPLITGGYALAAFARPLIGIVTAPWQLFTARIADRIGKGLRTAPRDALIADSTPAALRGRAFGFHRSMDHLGAALGPLLATAFLLAFPNQLRPLFLLTVLPGLAVVGLLAWKLQDQPSEGGRANPSDNNGPARSPQFSLTLRPLDRSFRLYLLALILFTLGNSSDAFLLVRASELGVPTAMLPLLWSVFHMVKSGGNVLAGRAADRLGARPLILAGWLTYAAIYLSFAFITQAWQAWVAFLLYGLFYATTEPAEKKLVTELVGTQQKGLAFGWFHFAIGIAALPSSVFFGWLYQKFGPLAAFGTGATLAAVAAMLLLCIPSTAAANEIPIDQARN